jgi:arylsulfatase A-like enzyme
MTGNHSAYFHRFYAAAAVCSPTRAALLTGRTNKRSCISTALRCDNEDPAPTCSMGPGLPWSEFTTADAAKKAGFATAMIGKWHLGDLWAKTDVPGYAGNFSSPSQHGFDEWVQTEAEASNSMPNCGCFPVNHTHPGPRPPSGYPSISPHGDQCVVGGGITSDWCYPCTNYYRPNASDPRGVSEWADKIPGNDAEFVVDRFEEFLQASLAKGKQFYAHLTFHAIHEPHPAMPQFYDLYEKDPDYLGALTMFDDQLGRLMQLLHDEGVYNQTVILYTADNGPHQGEERTDIRFSTRSLRQCKASNFEGGLRVPGVIHAPNLITKFTNVTAPAFTGDFLPTILNLLEVETDNPQWIMDGISLLPWLMGDGTKSEVGGWLKRPADKPIGISWADQDALIDNNWKLMTKPVKGQCDWQEPYGSMSKFDDHYLFDLETDYHELHDRKADSPKIFENMLKMLAEFKSSITTSQMEETGCGKA